MAEKRLMVDGIDLFEKHGDFDAGLVVGLRAVVELWMGELVVNLLPRHLCE